MAKGCVNDQSLIGNGCGNMGPAQEITAHIENVSKPRALENLQLTWLSLHFPLPSQTLSSSSQKKH